MERNGVHDNPIEQPYSLIVPRDSLRDPLTAPDLKNEVWHQSKYILEASWYLR